MTTPLSELVAAVVVLADDHPVSACMLEAKCERVVASWRTHGDGLTICFPNYCLLGKVFVRCDIARNVTAVLVAKHNILFASEGVWVSATWIMSQPPGFSLDSIGEYILQAFDRVKQYKQVRAMVACVDVLTSHSPASPFSLPYLF